MTREVYVTGSRGMVASRFVELAPQGPKILTPEIEDLDITDWGAIESFFDRERPDCVVHFAAFTDVGAAEKERGNKSGLCWKINVDGSVNLAQACLRHGALMVHVSTDYVFPGSSDDPGPYEESHKVKADSDRLTWYGYTKAVAEDEIGKILGGSLAIVRIIYPVRVKYGQKLDYIRKPLDLFEKGKLNAFFTDQQISISYIDEVAEAIKKIISGRRTGIFHAASEDTTTPHELVSYVIERAKGVKGVVKQASLDEFLRIANGAARYPKYGGLKVERTEEELGIMFSTWREIVDAIVFQIST